MNHATSRWTSRYAGALTAIALVACGCGGETLARRFELPRDSRVSLAAADSSETVLRFPADKPFNITDKTSTQSPGMTGSAKGDSQATPSGTAYCRVEAAQGGEASAEFHLGQCLLNPTDRPQIATATFLCEYDIRAEQTQGDQSPTASQVALEIYVNQENGRVLRRVPIENSVEDAEPAGGSGRIVKEFQVRLEPDTSYNFVLAGRVTARTDQAGSAKLEVEVKRLELTVRTGPASD